MPRPDSRISTKRPLTVFVNRCAYVSYVNAEGASTPLIKRRMPAGYSDMRTGIMPLGHSQGDRRRAAHEPQAATLRCAARESADRSCGGGSHPCVAVRRVRSAGKGLPHC